MDVILLEKVSKLGSIGDTVKVKSGFARNFLLPNKKAIRATEANKKVYEEKREELEKVNKEKVKIAKDKLKLVPKNIHIFREASEQGVLFGSVTSRDIAKEVLNDNLDISAKDIVLKSNIKKLGEYKVEIILHPEVITNLDIIVKNTEESVSKK